MNLLSVQKRFRLGMPKNKKIVNFNNLTGFTLAEVLVVISIIFIMGAVSLPLINRLAPHYRLKGASRELVSVLREAQSFSVTTQYNYLVRFFLDTQSYSIYRLDNENEYLQETIILPKNISIINATFENTQVIFTPSGTSQYSGTIQLINNLGESINIEVMISGQIKTY